MSKRTRKHDQDKPDAFTECYACGRWVGLSGERDHFPVPHSLGGVTVLPICQPCHDLKDRIPLDGWRPDEALIQLSRLWGKADPGERLMLAKMFHIASQGAAFLGAFMQACGGLVPYGWHRNEDGNIVRCESEQEVMAACRSLKDDGWTVAAIHTELVRRGLLMAGGSK